MSLNACGALYRMLNFSMADGTPGVRDLHAPCEFFSPPDVDLDVGIPRLAECGGDVHHLCRECMNCSRDYVSGEVP